MLKRLSIPSTTFGPMNQPFNPAMAEQRLYDFSVHDFQAEWGMFGVMNSNPLLALQDSYLRGSRGSLCNN